MVDVVKYETLTKGSWQRHWQAEKWGSHVVAVVTDNGANMTAMSALPAMRYPGPIPLRCAAHSLQLVIKDMLLQPLLEVLQLGVQSSCERFQGS